MGHEPEVNFEIIEGAPESHVILHVPHSSRDIPADVRQELLLDDVELSIELDEMTDANTDVLALEASKQARLRPWIFRNKLSRLVIDPERFPDEREIMNSVGMGAVYVKTSDGKTLRHPNSDRDDQMISRFFTPYSDALEKLTLDLLTQKGSITIIDVHSYRMREHSNSVNKGQRRPPICLGVDEFHTPTWLGSLAHEIFSELGEVVINEPYAGTYVPISLYQINENLTSVMMENREDVLLGEGIDRAATVLAKLIDGIESRQ